MIRRLLWKLSAWRKRVLEARLRLRRPVYGPRVRETVGLPKLPYYVGRKG
jgi:hypothetical protein